jgi:hypothetical protein
MSWGGLVVTVLQHQLSQALLDVPCVLADGLESTTGVFTSV